MTATVPPRVLAAEARREFRQLLNRSSLGCPTGDCDHPIHYHSASDYDGSGDPIDPRCDVLGCDCPQPDEIAGPCSYQLYPALGLATSEWCSDDALPGTDRCERHICDDEPGGDL